MGRKKKVQTEQQINDTQASDKFANLAISNLDYEGKVHIKYLAPNGKEIHFKGHNEGLNAMFKYLARALSGNFTNLVNEKPAFFDLRCSYEDVATGEVQVSSCLYNTLSLSNPEYSYDAGAATWATKFTIALSYNMINFDIVDNYITNDKNKFYIYIMSASGIDFARLALTDSSLLLTQIQPGTQAIIEWTMVIKNAK